MSSPAPTAADASSIAATSYSEKATVAQNDNAELDNTARNTHMAGYDCSGIVGRSPFTHLWAAAPNSTPLVRSRVEVAHITASEAATGAQEYLWVGMSPSSAAEYDQRRKTKHLGKKTIGHEQDALQVVVPIDGSPQLKFYGLIMVDGALQANVVPNAQVFYFAEFRDPAPSNERARREKWNTKIKDACKSTTSKRTPVAKFRVRSAPTIDLPIPPQHSLANEIIFYTAAYSKSKEKWLLDHLLTLIETADPSLRTEKVQALPHSIDESSSSQPADDNVVSSGSARRMEPDASNMLLATLTNTLRELVDYNKRYESAVAKMIGPHVVDDDLEEIWKTFAKRSDVDSCKMWLGHVQRYLHAVSCSKLKHPNQKMKELVEVMGALGF